MLFFAGPVLSGENSSAIWMYDLYGDSPAEKIYDGLSGSRIESLSFDPLTS